MSIQTPSLQVRHIQYSLNELLLYLNSQDQWLLILESCKSCLAKIKARLLIFLNVAHKQNEFNTYVIVMIEEFRLFHQTIVVEYPSQYNDFFHFHCCWGNLMKVPHECEAVFLKPISGAVYVVYCWKTRIQTQLQQKQKQWSKFIPWRRRWGEYIQKKFVEIQGSFLLCPSAWELRVYFNN